MIWDNYNFREISDVPDILNEDDSKLNESELMKYNEMKQKRL
jgi:hypothetical protein